MSHTTTNTHGSLKSYTIGFSLSIVLTLAAFWATWQHINSSHSLFPHEYLIGFIGFLAITQLLVQLFLFLHLGKESRPKWNLIAFLFMLLVVVIIVIGSVWIMKSLDYNMMSSHESGEYIINDEGFRRE